MAIPAAFNFVGNYVRDLATLKSKFGPRSPVYQHLALDSDGMIHHFDHFLGDTINADMYATAAAGTAAAQFAINVQAGGVIRGSTGTDDNAATSLIMPIIFSGDKNAGMEVKFKFDAVDALHWEVGFIEAVPAAATGAVNDCDTPTVYGANFAVVGMDTDQTLKTMWIISKGTTSGQDALKTNIGTVAPSAATWMTVRMQLATNDVFVWVNGTPYTHTYDAQGHLEGGTLVAPWIYCQTRSTTPVLMDVCKLRVWCEE